MTQIQRTDWAKKKIKFNWQAKELKKSASKNENFGVCFFSSNEEGNFLLQPESISICYELETGKLQNAETEGSNWGVLSSTEL